LVVKEHVSMKKMFAVALLAVFACTIATPAFAANKKHHRRHHKHHHAAATHTQTPPPAK
jgi:hypothetical protein